MGDADKDLHGRCALVLGISGPDPGLGEAELGGPGQLTEAPVRAGELAGRLAAYGYNDVLKRLGNTGNGIAAVQRSWTSPGESARLWLGVEEHFLARPAPGRM